MSFVVVCLNEEASILRKQSAKHLNPISHQCQPQRMLNSIVVLFERCPGVVGGIDVDALDSPRELLLKRLKREQVVPEDQTVIKDVGVCHTLLGVIALVLVFQKNPRFQAWANFFVDPSQFKSLLWGHS